jgi:hypothetical protein
MTQYVRRGDFPTSPEAPKPGDFHLGSPQSRAAARALLATKRTALFEGILIQLVSVDRDNSGRECTCSMPEAGKFALCRCFV